MTNDGMVNGLENTFTDLAKSGFMQFVFILLFVTFVFWSFRVLRALIKKYRERRLRAHKQTRKVPKSGDPNKWETEWELSERARKKQAKALTPKEQSERREQLKEDRETYRLQRRNNQWKK